ncbi:MAG: hypothetical protein BJ554DRAFT_589 [Olpidium bornovanus]|uniref:Uncharacterized protein n=1 Tax=Olpidium bornovanus TaxID=278681 RepID=A0A8H8DI16_9FUNG|nr:MAG: hypothetical protein BJ554DRAFT_589 [Olpidium bornovanus]
MVGGELPHVALRGEIGGELFDWRASRGIILLVRPPGSGAILPLIPTPSPPPAPLPTSASRPPPPLVRRRLSSATASRPPPPLVRRRLPRRRSTGGLRAVPQHTVIMTPKRYLCPSASSGGQVNGQFVLRRRVCRRGASGPFPRGRGYHAGLRAFVRWRVGDIVYSGGERWLAGGSRVWRWGGKGRELFDWRASRGIILLVGPRVWGPSCPQFCFCLRLLARLSPLRLPPLVDRCHLSTAAASVDRCRLCRPRPPSTGGSKAVSRHRAVRRPCHSAARFEGRATAQRACHTPPTFARWGETAAKVYVKMSSTRGGHAPDRVTACVQVVVVGPVVPSLRLIEALQRLPLPGVRVCRSHLSRSRPPGEPRGRRTCFGEPHRGPACLFSSLVMRCRLSSPWKLGVLNRSLGFLMGARVQTDADVADNISIRATSF